MCKWGTDRIIHVIHRNNEFVPDGWHPIGVDACIADLVQEMNNRGIITTGCCCGHGKDTGWVQIDPISEDLLIRYGYNYECVQISYLDIQDNPYTEPCLIHHLPLVHVAGLL